MITAIYDCRSKQEYIYRTNKIREISGASLLLSHIYELFIAEAEKNGITIKNSWRDDLKNGIGFNPKDFEISSNDGEVIYEGGGNLNIIYKDQETYIKANRIFSRMLLEKTYSISIITAFTETTENFNADRKKLYHAKNIAKNQGTFSIPCNILPITQTDRDTFLPVTEKKYVHGERRIRTQDARNKRDAYKKYYTENDEISTEVLDSLIVGKGESSMLAVIYIDGNDMGNKIKACTEGKNDYPDCVNALREFSVNTEEYYVNRPIKAIEDSLRKKNKADEDIIKVSPQKAHKYRKIIGGGDEITIICRAEDAIDIVNAYFEELKKAPLLANEKPNASCAGIAFFHSHAPFSNVYQIAESCCEMGKKKTRTSGSADSYIDFHYCHSGITNDLEALRAEQETEYTARPYRTDEFKEFAKVGSKLREIGRGNVKALGEAVVNSNSAFFTEIERIKSRNKGSFSKLIEQYSGREDNLKKLIYDISVVYDLWFSKGGD